MATFDPNNFLHLTITEASVKLPPLPPGDYVGVIGEVSASTWVEKNPKDGKAPGTGPKFEFSIAIQIPAEVQADLGYPDTYSMKDGILVSLKPNGAIDLGVGANGSLRRYREACDLNTPGEPFSPIMFTGKVITVRIKHDLWEGEPINRIGGVARPA